MRDRHTLVIGKTGQGKTSLLAWQAFKDIESREGAVCVIDPKGGAGALAEIVGRYIPEDRLDDCLWIDMEHPIPLDFMSHKKGHRDRVVADLTYILSKGELDAAAVELRKNIENLLCTLLNVNEHPDLLGEPELRCTLLDVYRFFKSPDRREYIRARITDPELASEWTKEAFPNPTAQGRVLSRINPIVRSDTLKKIFDDPIPRLNITEHLDKKGIILASLPAIHPAAQEYGALLVAKIQHAMFSRDAYESDRIPCFLYIDEFRYFRAAADFILMLTMARSFKLCLTLADLSFDLLQSDVRTALKIIDNYILLKAADSDIAIFQSRLAPDDDRGRIQGQINRLYEQWVAEGSEQYSVALNRLTNLRRYLKTIPQSLTIKDAHGLMSYEAIYMLADQPPILEPTPTPAPKVPTEEQQKKLEYIKRRSREHYGPRDYAARIAQFRPNRTTLSPTGLSPQVRHDEGDDGDKKISPSGPATV